jgi:hypothetical protein
MPLAPLLIHTLQTLPRPILVLGVFIVCLWLLRLVWMIAQAFRLWRSRRNILKFLLATQTASAEERADGLRLERVEAIRGKVRLSDLAVREWWLTVEGNLQRYLRSDGKERWYATDAAREAFPYDELFAGYDEASHQAVPGLLTALGLLGTFIALLMGLAHLEYTDKAVTGLRELINALSGKFLTSVLALAASVFFIIIERFVCEASLERLYVKICRHFDQSFPRIRPERILADIQLASSQQATSLANISSDLVGQFTGAFRTQIVPSLADGLAQQLTAQLLPAVQKMEGALERLESQKQDSVVGEIRNLVTTLETSITRALTDMGRQFHEQLSGSAKTEFAAAQSSLANTSQMLDQMHSQFELTRNALSELVQAANVSSSNQARASQEQSEALQQLMRGLIDELGRNASSNLQNIAGALTSVVADLTRKVEDVSESMVRSVGSVAAQSQEAANTLVSKTGAWTESTAQRLQALLDSIQVRSEEFSAAAKALLDSKVVLAEVLAKNSDALRSLESAARQVEGYTTALTVVGRNADDILKRQAEVIAQSRRVFEDFKENGTQNQQILEQYRRVVEQAKSVFDGLDRDVERVLTAVNNGMKDYVQTVENNFGVIVKHSNDYLPEISRTLQTQTQQLEQQLEELTGVFDRALKNGHLGGVA